MVLDVVFLLDLLFTVSNVESAYSLLLACGGDGNGNPAARGGYFLKLGSECLFTTAVLPEELDTECSDSVGERQSAASAIFGSISGTG